MNLETMVRLLSHRGSLFIIKETWVKGDDKVCPRCKGSGRFDDLGRVGRGEREDVRRENERHGENDQPGENTQRREENGRRGATRHAPNELAVPQPGSICAVCEGHGRAQKRFVVHEVPHWYFQVSDEGVEFSITLKREDIQVYFSDEEAQAWALFRNLQERTEVVTGVPGWSEM